MDFLGLLLLACALSLGAANLSQPAEFEKRADYDEDEIPNPFLSNYYRFRRGLMDYDESLQMAEDEGWRTKRGDGHPFFWKRSGSWKRFVPRGLIHGNVGANAFRRAGVFPGYSFNPANLPVVYPMP